MIYKIASHYIAGIVLFIIGSMSAYLLSRLVFDRSYMMTQGALAAPGTELQLWLLFIASIAVAVAGIILLVVWHKKYQS